MVSSAVNSATATQCLSTKALRDGAYRLIELEPDELPSFFKRDDIRGVNITLPYKRETVKFCGELSPEARYIGSVNTVVRDGAGLLKGFNTDLYGFRYIAEKAGIRILPEQTIHSFAVSGVGFPYVRFAAEFAGASEVIKIKDRQKTTIDEN